MMISRVSKWLERNRWDLVSLVLALIPAVFTIAMFSGNPLAPPGADSAHHAAFARNILESQRAYVAYSQFPSEGLPFEYPSLFDLSVALLVAGSGVDILAAMEGFVVGLAILSPLVMWRFLRRFFQGGPRDSFIAVALFSLNWFVLLKTVRDGSYGELLAAGVLLPLWLSFLWDRREILAAGTLFGIILAHNLTALLAFGCFIALLVDLALRRKWTRVRRIVLAHAGVVAITAVLVWPVYASYFLPVTSGVAGGFPPIDPITYVVILSPVLFLFGLLGAGLLARIPQGRFVALWMASYLVLSRTNFASERIARELSAPFAVAAAAFALWLTKRVDQDDGGRPSVWAAATLSVVVVLTAMNGVFWLAANSDPITLEYLGPYQLAAYRWLAANSNESEGVLGLASGDPYLYYFVSNHVFQVVNLEQAKRLSGPDRDLNVALVAALMNYTNATSRAVFSVHGIRWIVLSTPFLPPRWLAPEDGPFIAQAWNLNLESDPGYTLRHVETAPGGTTKIVQIVTAGGPLP